MKINRFFQAIGNCNKPLVLTENLSNSGLLQHSQKYSNKSLANGPKNNNNWSSSTLSVSLNVFDIPPDNILDCDFRSTV